MYRDEYSSESMYSVAEVAILLGTTIEAIKSLIKHEKIGCAWTKYGYVISNTHIASYLIASDFQTRYEQHYKLKQKRRSLKRK
jgi:hypothetical protein